MTRDAEYDRLLDRLSRDPGNDELREQLHARYLDLQRGGTTADGLPYPSPTDPVAEAADAIRALAEALTYRQVRNLTPALTAADVVNSYPRGISMMNVAVAAGWPGTGIALTWRDIPTGRALQIFTTGSELAPARDTLMRTGFAAAGWSSWKGLAGPYSQASGRFAFPSALSQQTVTQTVTLPAVFTLAPHVQLTLGNTAAPALRTVSVGAVTATSFVAAFANQASGSAVTLDGIWHAEQATSAAVATLAAAAAERAAGIPTRLVSCPNGACPAYGEDKDVLTGWLDDDGQLQLVDAIVCGVDGTLIEATSR